MKLKNLLLIGAVMVLGSTSAMGLKLNTDSIQGERAYNKFMGKSTDLANWKINSSIKDSIKIEKKLTLTVIKPNSFTYDVHGRISIMPKVVTINISVSNTRTELIQFYKKNPVRLQLYSYIGEQLEPKVISGIDSTSIIISQAYPLGKESFKRLILNMNPTLIICSNADYNLSKRDIRISSDIDNSGFREKYNKVEKMNQNIYDERVRLENIEIAKEKADKEKTQAAKDKALAAKNRARRKAILKAKADKEKSLNNTANDILKNL